MSRKVFLLLAVVLAGLLLLANTPVRGSSAAAAENLPDQPNIIIFIADDAGVGDIGAYGAPTIRTPNIDSIAREGTRFMQWYTPTGLCTPNRGSIMTGRMPIRIGLYSQFGWPLDQVFRVFYPSSIHGMPANETTIAAALKTKGYYSALIGKWHQGHVDSLPTKRGFDYFYGTPYSHDEGYPGPFPMALIWPPIPLYENERIIQQPVDLETVTQRMTNRALNVIDDAASRKQPFFLYMAYHEPHIPAFASPEFSGTSLRGRFGDMMEQMDSSIGQIMQHVRDLGLDDDTIVLFTSDNGAWPDAQEPFSATGDNHETDGGSNGQFYEGKGGTWEGGIRVPAIWKWTGKIAADAVSFAVTSMMDIFPTLLDILGIDPPEGKTLDGKSIKPILLGEDPSSPHEILFFWRELVLYACRYGPWKAHYYTRTGFGYEAPTPHDPFLLFNVEHDPGERFPVDLETVPEVVDEILRLTNEHVDSIEIGPPLFDGGGKIVPGQDWSVIPCCGLQDDPERLKELVEKQEKALPSLPPWFPKPELPELPEDWPLIVWEVCLCDNDNTTSAAPFVPPYETGYTFHGHPISYFEEVIKVAIKDLDSYKSPDPRKVQYTWNRNK